MGVGVTRRVHLVAPYSEISPLRPYRSPFDHCLSLLQSISLIVSDSDELPKPAPKRQRLGCGASDECPLDPTVFPRLSPKGNFGIDNKTYTDPEPEPEALLPLPHPPHPPPTPPIVLRPGEKWRHCNYCGEKTYVQKTCIKPSCEHYRPEKHRRAVMARSRTPYI